MLVTEQYKEITEQATPKPKWRNLIYDKKGHAFQGERIRDSIGACRDVVREIEARIANGDSFYIRLANGESIYCRQYSWSMQIPILPTSEG
jgi:hypothetical protein